MGRNEDKEILYGRPVPSINAQWNAIQIPFHIYNFLTYQDIAYLNQIAKSNKLAGNPNKKKKLIIQLMELRGFKKLDCGTNRLVFKFMENQSFLIKVAFDKVALHDNIREYNNQEYLKPFCAKCFEVTPCGTVGLFERVYAVKTKEEFASIASTVFDIIVNCFLGKFVLADFGTKFYKNWGVREGAYPVILDYPYLYELDGGKLFCNKEDPSSEIGYCGGEIDYDDGFNFLVCKKCGKVYLASELSKENKNNNIIITGREETRMKIQITKRDGTVLNLGETNETKTYKKYDKKETPHEYQMRRSLQNLKVHIGKCEQPEPKVVEENKPDKVQVSSVYGEMVPKVGDEFKEFKVAITNRKGIKYVGGEAKNISLFSPISNYANLYGSGAEVIKKEPETVVDSTVTEVVDEPVYNMDISDVKEPKVNSEVQAVIDQNNAETLHDLFMGETVSVDELNDNDQIIAAHCDSDSIRYKINNIKMTDENKDLEDEDERLKKFKQEKTTTQVSQEVKDVAREMAQSCKDEVDSKHVRPDAQVFYNGKPMPNFEKDRNLKVLDQAAYNSLSNTPPDDTEDDGDEKEKQYVLDQF